jgi:Polyketide cyclase / dehydrase and lipid transport
MIETIAIVIIALGAIVVAIVAIASRRPGTFKVARSLSIRSEPERLFPLINDLHAFNTWNPFAQRDPNARAVYRGPACGKGAVHTFDGKKSGTGQIEIVDAAAPKQVTMRLTMVKPFRADNTVNFTLEPRGDATNVTWAMSGQSPLLAKVIGLFINCDNMVGKDFEQGLSNLRAIAEKA